MREAERVQIQKKDEIILICPSSCKWMTMEQTAQRRWDGVRDGCECRVRLGNQTKVSFGVYCTGRLHILTKDENRIRVICGGAVAAK